MNTRAFEIRHFTGHSAANGESDFIGPTSVLSTEERIEFLRAFAATARRFFGNEKWDRLAVPAEQVADALQQLKPQPLPAVRRARPITHWRWTAAHRPATKPEFTFPAQTWRFLVRLRVRSPATVNVGAVLRCQGDGDLRIEVALDDGCARVNGELVKLTGTGPVDRVTVSGGAVEEIWVQSYADTRAVHGQRPLQMTTVFDWTAQPLPDLAGWNEPGCDDTAWPVSEAPFAHGGERHAGEDLYLRHRFRVAGTGRVWLRGETLFPGGEVWVNGRVVAVLHDPRPFVLDLTGHVRPDTENLLAIRVFPFRVAHWIAHGCSDLNSGWFAGRCRIEETGDDRIEDLWVTTEGEGFRVRAQVRSWVWGPADVKGGPDPRRVHRLRVQVRPWFPADGPVVAEATTEVPLVYFGRTVTVDLRLPVPGGEWWTPARPFLYRVDAVLVAADGTPLDDAVVTSGLRTVDQKGGVFRLNGQPELLRGGLLFGMRPPLEEQVRLLRCAPVEHLVREVLSAKNCGGNCIRVTIHESTYRGCNDPRLAEIGDQLGICFLWSTSAWVRTASPWQIELDVLAADARLVRNHPSIVMWQPGNHPKFFNVADAMAWWREVFETLLAVDDSRLISPAGGLAEPPGDVADEPTWNHPLAARGGFETPTGYAKGWSFLREWPDPPAFDDDFGWTRTRHKRELLASRTHAFFDFESEETIGQPNWELLRGTPVWQLWSYEHGYDEKSIGRLLEFDEWEVSQAWQALSAAEAYRKKRWLDYDSLLWCTLDGGGNTGTYMKPLTDHLGHAKIAYHALRMVFQDTFAGSGNVDVSYGPGDVIPVRVFHLGEARTVRVTARIRTPAGELQAEKVWPEVMLPAGRCVVPVADWMPQAIAGLAAVEYEVQTVHTTEE